MLIAPSRISAVLLLLCCFLFAQEQTAPASQPQTGQPSTPPANEPAQPMTGQRPVEESAHPSVAHPSAHKTQQSPKEQAWEMLESACTGDKKGNRAIATRVLGLLPNDNKAMELARNGLSDDTAEVRVAAAAALGDMNSRTSIPVLKKALNDEDPAVVLAAAHSLAQMHDEAAYEVYFEVLNGERKSGKGLIATQKAILSDPKKLAELGFEEGIGFIPFAGIGWNAIKRMTKDDTSPVRAAAAKVLANDPDPDTTRALVDAVGDKSWLVRAAALEALAKRGDPSVLRTVEPSLTDEKDAVKYTAAAAVLRLTAIKKIRPAQKNIKRRANNRKD